MATTRRMCSRPPNVVVVMTPRNHSTNKMTTIASIAPSIATSCIWLATSTRRNVRCYSGLSVGDRSPCAPLPHSVDGQVPLQLKRPWSEGTTHLRCDQVELLERLAVITLVCKLALMPPVQLGELIPCNSQVEDLVPSARAATLFRDLGTSTFEADFNAENSGAGGGNPVDRNLNFGDAARRRFSPPKATELSETPGFQPSPREGAPGG